VTRLSELEVQCRLLRDGYYIEGLEHRDISAWIVCGKLPGLSLLSAPAIKRRPKPRRRRDRRKAKAARVARRANR